jgi:SAM-dependent methyltransferase
MQMQATTFYDDHPFDWTEGYSEAEAHATLAPLLASFIKRAPAEALILDIGCGAGRVMSCLAARGLRAVGLDVSRASVRLMTERTGEAGVVGNGLRLPFPDGCADRLIADGVIHHTGGPFTAFAECCRVLKPAGLFYAAVYKPGGRYQKLYRSPGSIIRRLVKHGAGRVLVHSTMLPIYYLAHLAKSRGKTPWHGAKNLFYDYFVTPTVEFLSRDQVEQWANQCGVEIVNYDPNPGLNVHSFIFRRPVGQ